MKIKIYSLIIVSFFAINAKSQVTIGSLDAPHRGAVLELRSDTLGFLPTRVELTSLIDPEPLPVHVEGMIVYNKTENVDKKLQSGLYYNTGSRWARLSATLSFTENWFYMPPVEFDTSDPSDKVHTMKLYERYIEQLNSSDNVKASKGAPVKALSVIPEAKDLYYYVTSYDDKVFEILSIDENGNMEYRVKQKATDDTFINIILVEK